MAGKQLKELHNPSRRLRLLTAAVLFAGHGGVSPEVGLGVKAVNEQNKRVRAFIQLAQESGNLRPSATQGSLPPSTNQRYPYITRPPQQPVILLGGSQPLLPSLSLDRNTPVTLPTINLPLTTRTTPPGEAEIDLPLIPPPPPSILPFRLAGPNDQQRWLSDQPAPPLD